MPADGPCAASTTKPWNGPPRTASRSTSTPTAPTAVTRPPLRVPDKVAMDDRRSAADGRLLCRAGGLYGGDMETFEGRILVNDGGGAWVEVPGDVVAALGG